MAGTKGTKWSGRVRKAAQDVLDDSVETARESGTRMSKDALASGKDAVADAGQYVKGMSATMIGKMAHGAAGAMQRAEKSANRSAALPVKKKRQSPKKPPSK